MQTFAKKRLEIIIESPALRRITKLLDQNVAHGYTVLPVYGGSGESGPWTRDDTVSSAEGMVAVVCILDAHELDNTLERVFKVVSRHIGVINVSDCQVLRDDKF